MEAVSVPEPFLTAVTSPLEFTVNIDSSLLDQVTAPVKARPF